MLIVGEGTYDHVYLLIQATVCGLGVAAVPPMLAMNDLLPGKWVAPSGSLPGWPLGRASTSASTKTSIGTQEQVH
jgi:hypothetical protein